MRHETLRIAVRWLLLLTGWLGLIVAVFVVGPQTSEHEQDIAVWSFVAGAVLARVVPRVWRWAWNDENAPPPIPRER